MSALIVVTGNVTTEPAVKNVGGAEAVVFQLGTNTTSKNADGSYEKNYYNCILYGKSGETFMRIVQKSSNITVHGQFYAKEFKKKDGTIGTALNILCEGKIEYHQRLKNSESDTIRSSDNKPDYERVKKKSTVVDDEDSPW